MPSGETAMPRGSNPSRTEPAARKLSPVELENTPARRCRCALTSTRRPSGVKRNRRRALAHRHFRYDRAVARAHQRHAVRTSDWPSAASLVGREHQVNRRTIQLDRAAPTSGAAPPRTRCSTVRHKRLLQTSNRPPHDRDAYSPGVSSCVSAP